MEITKKIYDLQSLSFLRNANLKIGVLGGSFDPAHEGHLLISLQALKHYNFNYIIWLVANQNPLKPSYKLNIFERSKQALTIANHPKIIVSTLEYDFNTHFTSASLKCLIKCFKNIEFTWLMGVDNLENFHSWCRAEEITKLVKMIIFDRPVSLRLVNNSRFMFKFKPIVAKTQTNNIIIHRGNMSAISSSKIKTNR